MDEIADAGSGHVSCLLYSAFRCYVSEAVYSLLHIEFCSEHGRAFVDTSGGAGAVTLWCDEKWMKHLPFAT